MLTHGSSQISRPRRLAMCSWQFCTCDHSSRVELDCLQLHPELVDDSGSSLHLTNSTSSISSYPKPHNSLALIRIDLIYSAFLAIFHHSSSIASRTLREVILVCPSLIRSGMLSIPGCLHSSPLHFQKSTNISLIHTLSSLLHILLSFPLLRPSPSPFV
jgi:hypothetical protein